MIKISGRSSAALLLALLLSLPSTLEARRKPKNPRRAKRAAAAAKAARDEAPKDALKPGRWSPEVKKAVEELAARRGKDSPGYDAARPPVAVLPWDNAAIEGDLAESAFLRMIENVDFKIDDEFWRLVPVVYGRQALRAAYAQFSAEPVSAWSRQGSFLKFRRDFLRAYRGMCARVGRKQCRSFLVELFWKFGEEEARSYARASVQEGLARTFQAEIIGTGAEDPLAIPVQRGLRLIPEIEDLSAFLRRSGFELAAVGDDAQWLLEAMAGQYGISPARAAGIRSEAKEGKLTSKVIDPVPFRGGKTDAMVSLIGRDPDLCLGADPWDLEMLGYGKGLRLYLDKGDEASREFAAEKGWLIQPAFASGPGGRAEDAGDPAETP